MTLSVASKVSTRPVPVSRNRLCRIDHPWASDSLQVEQPFLHVEYFHSRPSRSLHDGDGLPLPSLTRSLGFELRELLHQHVRQMLTF